MSTKCKFCGSPSYGTSNDSRHPQKVHVHPSDGVHCIYCGSTSYGTCNDSRHPDGVHEK